MKKREEKRRERGIGEGERDGERPAAERRNGGQANTESGGTHLGHLGHHGGHDGTHVGHGGPVAGGQPALCVLQFAAALQSRHLLALGVVWWAKCERRAEVRTAFKVGARKE
jgi:hypothetical protein